MRSNRMFWERFRTAYPVKATALTLIVAMGFLACGGREAALNQAFDRAVNYDSLPAKAPRPTKPADKLHAAVTELKDLVAVQASRDLSGKQVKRAAAARERIDNELAALRRQFKADRAKLKKLKAKAALKRLQGIEGETAELEAMLWAALDQLPAAGRQSRDASQQALDLLKRLSPEKAEQPTSSNLGFGIDNAKPGAPSLSAGITPAYHSPTATEAGAGLPRTPEQEDLAETPETRLTPALRALALDLDEDPVKIYQYVRNTIRFEPYLGIRKGADQTLAERSGSAADQAALLVALLRSSNIHARFVQGTVQLPAATAANWLEVDTVAGERSEAAPDILASAGIPTTQIRADGHLSKVRFEHFWAEAYVESSSYRGVDEQLGEKQWLPLDPSIKQHRFSRPDHDLKDVLKPIAAESREALLAGASPMDDSAFLAPDSGDVRGAAATTGAHLREVLSDLEITAASDPADYASSTEILQEVVPYLPSSMPGHVLSVSNEQRAIPAAKQARVTFSVSGADPLSQPTYDPEVGREGGFSYSARATDLANRRITLAYVPATEDDAAIIDAYHGLLNAPTYAAALIPVLRIDGRVVARGHTAVSTGYTQRFDLTYQSPGYAPDTVTNPVYVGSLSAVALDLGSIARSQLKARTDALRTLASSTTAENVLTDARGGELLSQLGAQYFLRNDEANAHTGPAAGVHQSRALSGAIVATGLSPRYVGSFPVSVRFDSLTIDVDQDSQVVVATSGDESAVDAYMRISGMQASSSEAEIFEYSLNWQAMSTTRVLAAAAEAGVPIHEVSADNIDTELGRLQLPEHVERNIAEAVATPGVEVITPQRPVTVAGWSGSGYIVSSGSSADYRISGGISGGSAPVPSPGNGGSGGGPIQMAAAIPFATHQFVRNEECDHLKMWILFILAVIAVMIMLLVIATAPGSIWVIHTALTIGVATEFSALWLVGIPAGIAIWMGLWSYDEARRCDEYEGR